MNKTSDIISCEVNELRAVSSSLSSLSRAFKRIGNLQLAEELSIHSESIRSSADTIFNSYHEEWNIQAQQSITNSNRFFGTILKGLLEGDDPKDVCLEGVKHHFDKDLIDEFESREGE